MISKEREKVISLLNMFLDIKNNAIKKFFY